jgi:hypothetical protein
MLIDSKILKAKKANVVGFSFNLNYVEMPAAGNLQPAELYILCRAKCPITNEEIEVRVLVQTEAYISNFSAYWLKDNFVGRKEIKRAFFYESQREGDPFQSFLKAIKKDSDLLFQVVAFNTSDEVREAGFACHQLYGVIDGNKYLLAHYTGRGHGPITTI